MTPFAITPEVQLGGSRLVLFAGPCVIESEDHALRMATSLADVARAAGVGFVYKSSFDKANRSSLESYRGPGLDEGLRILALVRAEARVAVTTDVHEPSQCPAAAKVVDVLQIPAFLSRQTDLLVAAARSGKPVTVKKGQFAAPEDMAEVVHKLRASGASGVALMERGASFGYHNLVVDYRSLVIMRALGVPVLFDGTHSVQLPGAAGSHSGGDRHFVAPLVRAAAAVGIDGLFLEVHDCPDCALCDGPNQLSLADLPALLDTVVRVREASGGG